MKKLRCALVMLLVVGLFTGCSGGGSGGGAASSGATSDSGGGVSITVVTPFSASDGNRGNYVSAYTAFEAATGNTIIDVETAAIDEAWKKDVLEDFRSGNEPDVINFFIGADADELIANDKLVSIGEIRKEYPDYASNMKESLIPVSTYDGRQYAVPVYGYWEGLFVNKKVLEQCGVALPGADYTWEQFLVDCQTIRDKGYTPIACSLTQVPHYWFEYCVFNNGTVTDHTAIPLAADDAIGQSWVAGLSDIKALYDEGFFPENTLEANDDTTALMILRDEAAFLLDGSWKVGWFQDNAEATGADLNDFTVTYVPSRGVRKSTDAIGGISMGYSITRKAWDDPAKRKVCVDFITAMTTDEVTSTFGELTVTALKNGVIPSGAQLNALAESTIAMTKGCTAMVPAAQDALTPSARDNLFKNIPNIVQNRITAQAALAECLALE